MHGRKMAWCKLIDLRHIAGDKWRSHRKILTAAFHFKVLEEYVQVFNSNSQALVQKLEEHVGQPFVDITSYIAMCTLDIICGETLSFINYLPVSRFYYFVKEALQKVPHMGVSHLTEYVCMYFQCMHVDYECTYTYVVAIAYI
jgi:hypothetical protein